MLNTTFSGTQECLFKAKPNHEKHTILYLK